MNNPLQNLDQWEDFVADRYSQPGTKGKDDYRNYDNPGRDSVREFYRLNHRHQTYDFVLEKKRKYLAFEQREMTVLEAMDYLNTLVDDSDPDTDLSQKEHLLQTAEAIRADGHEDWFVLTGLIHDLGKILCLFGEPQWAVVGDTFPVGCAFSSRIVYLSFWRRTLTGKTHGSARSSASTKKAAACGTCISPGDTTNTSTTSSPRPAAPSPSRPSP